jgi:hypothetical protein
MKIRKTIAILLLLALLVLVGVPVAQAIRPLYSPFTRSGGKSIYRLL